MKTVKIELSHKNAVNEIRRRENHALSSHAFQSLYLWQDQMGLSLYLKEDFFSVKAELFGENTWFFPCGKKESVLEFIKKGMEKNNFSLKYLRENDKLLLENAFPDKWEFTRDDASDEYICDIQKYTSLEGSKFSEIRRNIRKINKEYNVSFRVLEDETLSDALFVVNKWGERKHNVDSHNMTDYDVPLLALTNKDALDITGIIMYLEDKPTALFAGFPINDDVIDIAIGKCIYNSPRATTYYALKKYLELTDKYTYCNHEEDLGIMSIRRVKESLDPVMKNIMWEAKLK